MQLGNAVEFIMKLMRGSIYNVGRVGKLHAWVDDIPRPPSCTDIEQGDLVQCQWWYLIIASPNG